MASSTNRALGTKTAKSSQGYWTPQMLRIVLDFVDESASDKSVFIENRTKAIEQTLEKLRPTIDTDTFNRLNEKSILNKLGKQASLGGFSTMHELFEKGTTTLDLSKLQKGTYSDAEIEEVAGKISGTTQEEPSTARRSDDLAKVEATGSRGTKRGHEGNDGDEITIKKNKTLHSNDNRGADSTISDASEDKRRASGQNAESALVRRPEISPGRNNADESDTSRLRLPRGTKRGAEDDIEPASQHKKIKSNHASNIDVGTSASRPSRTRIERAARNLRGTNRSGLKSDDNKSISTSQNTNELMTAEKVFVCEHCDAEYQTKSDLVIHKNDHGEVYDEAFEIPRRLPVACGAEWEGMVSELHPTTKALIELERLNDRRYTSEDYMRGTMDDIQGNIFYAVREYLGDLKADGNATIRLDTTKYESYLTELLVYSFGHEIREEGNKDGKVPYPDNEISRFGVMASIVGSAVHYWALQPAPQGEVDDGILGKVNEILQVRSPDFQDNVLHLATIEYLKEHVKPQTSGAAQSLADTVLYMLRHFIPTATQGNPPTRHDPANEAIVASAPLYEEDDRDHNPDDETSQQSHGSKVNADSTSPLSNARPFRWPLGSQRNPEQQFREKLYRIFRDALNLRLDMEIKGNAIYKIALPRVGDDLRDSMAVHHVSRNDPIRLDPRKRSYNDVGAEDGARAIKVLIPLTPAIYARTRTHSPFKDYGEERLLCRSSVVTYMVSK